MAIVLAAAACSGDDGGPASLFTGLDEVDADTDGSGGDGSDGGASGDGGLPSEAFAVGHKIWHSGFEITVGDGTFVAEETLSGEPLYVVTLDATFTNAGPEENSFFNPVNLVANGLAAIRAESLDEIPRVPAGLTSAGTFVFYVEPDFDLNTATLVMGFPEDKQAVIPLGSNTGELVTLEPAPPPSVSGTLSLELIDLEVTSAELRSDVPVNFEEVAPGELALTINFDATSRRQGNWSLFAEHFALIDPGGNALSLDGADLHNLIGSDEGALTPDHYVRFLIDEPAEGIYTLRFTPSDVFVGEDGVGEATLEFQLG